MAFLAVPPRESITPRRKQHLYEFANQLYNYGSELLRYKDSAEFKDEDLSEQELINEELAMLEKLNVFQVEQIQNF